MKNIILIFVLNSIVFFGFAQDTNPVSWKFSAEKIAALTYKVKFEASIDSPYHIYPQQASGGGLGMPTEFLFKEDRNIEFVGEVEEKGLEKMTGGDVAYYAKGVTFSRILKLKVEKTGTLEGTIKYMACTDQFCRPPAAQTFSLTFGDQSEKVSAAGSSNTTSTQPKGETGLNYQDFVMADTDGKLISSKEITSKSKYTFIDFWASWCVPCRVQGRELIPIYNKFKPEGLAVIGVSLDTRPEPWKKAIEADGYTWTNVSDLKGFESEISKRYGIIAIPRNLLVDKEGNIVAKDLHGKELEAKLASLFP